MNYMWTDTEQPLSKQDTKEVERLRRRHHDIWALGAGALEREREKEELQERQQAWVTASKLACFKCGATFTTWAAGGRSQRGRLWVICTNCVRKPRA